MHLFSTISPTLIFDFLFFVQATTWDRKEKVLPLQINCLTPWQIAVPVKSGNMGEAHSICYTPSEFTVLNPIALMLLMDFAKVTSKMPSEECNSSIHISWISIALLTKSKRFVRLAPKVSHEMVILIVLIFIFLMSPCVSYLDRPDSGINPRDILSHNRSTLILIKVSLQWVTPVNTPEKITSSISSHAANIWCLRAAGKTLCSSFLHVKHFSSANCIL